MVETELVEVETRAGLGGNGNDANCTDRVRTPKGATVTGAQVQQDWTIHMQAMWGHGIPPEALPG
jgi:hypothetical protein